MSRITQSMLLLGANYPPEPTGNAPYTGALARGLAARGNNVRVLTTHPHYPAWRIASGYGQWTRREHSMGVNVVRLRHYVPSTPTSIRRALSEISVGIRQATSSWANPNVILAVSPALLATAVSMLRRRLFARSTPFVVWVQDLYSLGLSETGQGNRLVLKVMAMIEGWVLRHASAVIVIHERFASRITDDFAIPLSRIRVVRNWTHLTPPPTLDRELVRRGFGWRDDETIILHAGNMGLKQGLGNVVEAARLADHHRAPVRFVLLGGGSERDALVSAASGVSRIQFIDPLTDDDFLGALQAADVLLVNERAGVAEMSVPSKLTSYFNVGRPVLAAAAPHGVTASELNASGGGVLVDPGNPEALLEGALSFHRDPHFAAEIGRNGLNYRHTVLNEDSALDQFTEILGSFSGGQAKPDKHPTPVGSIERSNV